jgi:hypothetical protein
MSIAAIDPESRSRIPLPRREDLNSEGQKIFDYFTSGSKGVLRGLPCHARTLACASSGRRRSAAAKLGWIIVGRRVVVVGPQTTRNGVVAIDPHTTRSGVAWDHSLAGTNDDMSRFGMMPSCGGVRRSTESDQKA